MRRLIAVVILVGTGLLLAQTWNDGPLGPVWTPSWYEWVWFRSGFTFSQEDGRRVVDVNMPDVSGLQQQVAALNTTVATLQGQVAQLSSRVAELEANALPPPPGGP